MREIDNTSYDADDREHLLSFMDVVKNLKPKEQVGTEGTRRFTARTVLAGECDFLNRAETNSLYYLAGYIFHSIREYRSHCENCYGHCVSNTPPVENYTRFNRLKDYTGHSLVYVSNSTFKFFVEMERLFRKNIKPLRDENQAIMRNLVDLFRTLPHNFASCCNIRGTLIKKFASLRLTISEKRKKRVVRHDSLTLSKP
jgi:hypothetical protein